MTSYVSLLVCMISDTATLVYRKHVDFKNKLVKKSRFVQTVKFFRRSYFNKV